MDLICESTNLNEYLKESDEVDFSQPTIQELLDRLYKPQMTEIEIIKKAFEYVRDEILHSWDIRSHRVTCTASEVSQYKEGICYAKSNLLSALLRPLGIPVGFCYQRLTLGDTPETGYCVHALNAVYISELRKWIRLDARGNKEGINSQFNIHREQLAFQIRTEYNERDYPMIYKEPNKKTIKTLKNNDNCIKMYLNYLPTDI